MKAQEPPRNDRHEILAVSNASELDIGINKVCKLLVTDLRTLDQYSFLVSAMIGAHSWHAICNHLQLSGRWQVLPQEDTIQQRQCATKAMSDDPHVVRASRRELTLDGLQNLLCTAGMGFLEAIMCLNTTWEAWENLRVQGIENEIGVDEERFNF